MVYITSYVLALVIFASIDFAWLFIVGAALFRQTLGDLLLPSFRIAPAIFFYLFYPVGLVIFAIYPGLKASSALMAASYGALFGLFAYSTYELTNYATIKSWTFQLFAVDTIYGAIASGAAAGAVTVLTPIVLNVFSISAR